MNIFNKILYLVLLYCALPLVQAYAEDASGGNEEQKLETQICAEPISSSETCFIEDSDCFTGINFLSGYWDVTAKVGVACSLSKKLQRLYSSALPIYEIEGSYRTCCGWGLWGNIAYTTKKGHAKVDLNCSTCEVNKFSLKSGTRMQLLQLASGLEYTFNLPCNFIAYLGAGLTYSFLWITNDSNHSQWITDDSNQLQWVTNDSHHSHSKIDRTAFGGIVKSGLSYYFNECFHADLFLDYTVTQFHVRNFDYETINVGVGLGASF